MDLFSSHKIIKIASDLSTINCNKKSLSLKDIVSEFFAIQFSRLHQKKDFPKEIYIIPNDYPSDTLGVTDYFDRVGVAYVVGNSSESKDIPNLNDRPYYFLDLNNPNLEINKPLQKAS